MDIDPFKIPAYQRKKKTTFSADSFLRMDKDPEVKILNKLKQENSSAIRKNRITNNEKPISCNTKRVMQTFQGIPAWRKMDRIGEVEQYFEKIDVIALKLQKPLKVGERIVIESPKGLFEQEILSMQINRQDVEAAKKGEDVGIKVQFEPLPGGSVYKVVAQGE
jgi:hypothetical protein